MGGPGYALTLMYEVQYYMLATYSGIPVYFYNFINFFLELKKYFLDKKNSIKFANNT